MRRYCLWFGMLCSATLLVGCGGSGVDYSAVELVSVSGTVSLDGTPMPGLAVTFEAEDKTVATGMTDGNGRYELRFDSDTMGTTPGRKIVRISAAASLDEEGGGEMSEGEEEAEGDPDAAEENVELVPECYNTESKLTAEVSSSGGTFNFELKSDCSTTGPST